MSSLSRKTSTKWNLFFQYSAISIGVLKGLIIVPFYIKFIDIGLYGLWLASGNILVWITLIDPGLSDVLQQKIAIYNGKNDKVGISKSVTSGIFIGAAIAILTYGISIIFLMFIPEILNIVKDTNNKILFQAFNVTAISTSIQLFTYSLMAISYGFLRPIAPGIIYIVAQIIGVIINVLMLFNGFGLMAIAAMMLISSIIILFGNLIYVFLLLKKEKIRLIIDFKYMKNFSKIFSYTFFTSIISKIADNMDLILVARFISPESVTMLELTRRPMKVIQNFTNRPSVALKPALSHLWGEGQVEKSANYISRMINILIIISFFMAGGFVLFNKSLIGLWVGQEYFIGNSLNLILVVNFLILFSIAYNSSQLIFAIGQIKKFSIGNIIQSFVFIILLIVLGKFFGLFGIVIAMGASLLISSFWFFPYLLFKKINLGKSQLKKIILTFIISLALFTCAVLFSDMIVFTNWFDLIMYTGYYSIIYFAVQFILNINLKQEIVLLIKSKPIFNK